MPRLSFIVPVYNVAPYLRKCVDSLIAQDYDDYEIILVDDGSTDESPAICDEYAASSLSAAGTSPFSEADHSIIPIRVFHQQNSGLSAARNAGIKCANGDYLCFVDSDDYWEENVLGGLMVQVERDNLDVLRFDYQNVRLAPDGTYETFEPYKRSHRLDNDYSEEVIDGVSFLNTRMSTACYAVMFILRRDIILNLKSEGIVPPAGKEIINHKSEIDDCLFTPGIYFEDTDWTPRMLIEAQRVASAGTIVYNYLVREGSITKAVNRAKQQKVLDDKMRLIGEMQRQSKVLEEKNLNNSWFNRMIADTVISVISILSVDFYAERKPYLTQLKQMEIYPIQSKSSKAKLINLSPRLAVELLHMKNH